MSPELKLHVEPPRSRLDLATWLPRIGVGLFFVFVVGAEKFKAQSPWIRVFDQIGLGQWFRYITGAMQIAGGILMVIPRMTIIGAVMLACTLIGAIIANVFILHTGLAFLFLAVLLAIVVAVGWHARGR